MRLATIVDGKVPASEGEKWPPYRLPSPGIVLYCTTEGSVFSFSDLFLFFAIVSIIQNMKFVPA